MQGDHLQVGQGERHLSFRVRQGATTLKAIGWNMAERAGELMSAGRGVLPGVHAEAATRVAGAGECRSGGDRLPPRRSDVLALA
ncbi:MAG: hypothetical protein U0797_29185 [Gemmataceae bacterium]